MRCLRIHVIYDKKYRANTCFFFVLRQLFAEKGLSLRALPYSYNTRFRRKVLVSTYLLPVHSPKTLNFTARALLLSSTNVEYTERSLDFQHGLTTLK
jgi:hypothetical protein